MSDKPEVGVGIVNGDHFEAAEKNLQLVLRKPQIVLRLHVGLEEPGTRYERDPSGSQGAVNFVDEFCRVPGVFDHGDAEDTAEGSCGNEGA